MKLSSHKAFTLIELLVVIAIIAILAAILFPVFAQAKEAAKKTRSISHAKQVGTAAQIYLGDYDDTFMLALLPGSGGTWSSAGADLPADKRSTSNTWVPRHQSFYANALEPYSKNRDIWDLQEAKIVSNFNSATDLKVGPNWSLSMNGILHNWNATAIDQISRVTLFWYGQGSAQYKGIAFQNPYLRCTGVNYQVPCRFTPGAIPIAGGASSSFGHVRRAYTDRPVAVYSGGNIFVRADTSTKFVKLAPPGTTNNFTDVDPYRSYDAAGNGTASNSCARPGESVYYWCNFRPDWDFTYNGWDLL